MEVRSCRGDVNGRTIGVGPLTSELLGVGSGQLMGQHELLHLTLPTAFAGLARCEMESAHVGRVE